MQNHRQNRTLNRPRNQRVALIRGLALSLIKHGKVRTTEAKAKELRPYVERLVTYGKKDTVTARRTVASRLGETGQAEIKKLFDEIAPKYKDREGGYTRIVKMGTSQAGRSEAVIEFV